MVFGSGDSRLTVVRSARNLTQAQLSNQSGVPNDKLSRFEAGRERMSHANAERIARALNLRVADLFTADELGENEFVIKHSDSAMAKARKRLHLTQSDLAEKVYVSQPSINAYERGVTIPSRKTQEALSRTLRESEKTLFGDNALNIQPGDSPLVVHRKNLDMTAGQFANRLGIDTKTLRGYERNGKEPERIEIIKRICAEVNKRPSQMFKLKGTGLKKVRVEYLKTQPEIATLLNIAVITYRHYEQGNRPIPKKFVEMLGRYYNVGSNVLMEGLRYAQHDNGGSSKIVCSLCGQTISTNNSRCPHCDQRVPEQQKNTSQGRSKRTWGLHINVPTGEMDAFDDKTREVLDTRNASPFQLAMRAKKLSVDQLASRIGISANVIASYSSGRKSTDDTVVLKKICRVLDRSPSQLFNLAGNGLKISRLNAFQTQREVADKIGVPESIYNDYERGARRIPELLVGKLSRHLRVHSSDLTRGVNVVRSDKPHHSTIENFVLCKCCGMYVLRRHTQCDYCDYLTNRSR